MKKIILAVVIFLTFGKVQAQFDVNLSMGLDVRSSPSFKDYVNYVMASKQVASFKTTGSFSGGIDYYIKNNFTIGVEYNLQMDSYNVSSGAGGAYEISYNFHRPSILAYYVIPGNGYQFKFGGGVGYRYASLKQQLMDTQNFTSSGFGLLGRAVGNTILAKNFYALIGVDIRYDFAGDLTNSSETITNPATKSKVNLNMFSVGVFLGLTFKL
jgi:hypothetical protein